MVSHLFLLMFIPGQSPTAFYNPGVPTEQKKTDSDMGWGGREKEPQASVGWTNCIICNIMFNVSKCIEKYYFSKQPRVTLQCVNNT